MEKCTEKSSSFTDQRTIRFSSKKNKGPSERTALAIVVSRILSTPKGIPPFIYATYPPASDGPSSIAGIHGLATRKVCLSYGVTPRTGELLPHLFTLACFSVETERIGGLNLCSTICHPFSWGLPFEECGAQCCPDFPPRLPGAVETIASKGTASFAFARFFH